MRVIEPGSKPPQKKTGKATPRQLKKWFKWRYLVALLLIIGSGAIFWAFSHDSQLQSTATSNQQSTPVNPPPPTSKPRTLKTFTGEQFKQLYEATVYPNTEPISQNLSITGNIAADQRIRALAEARGYKVRSIPVAPIHKIGDPNLSGDDLLQLKALESWKSLKDMAEKDNVTIRILSGYRSPELQRSIFTSRLDATGATTSQVAAGKVDDKIDYVLSTTSVPGYSRHHTGYTVDFQCGSGALEAFVNSSCYSWISKNNFEKAKINGWIPSYPSGTGKQGPDPEPWEFVWVGTDKLYE